MTELRGDPYIDMELDFEMAAIKNVSVIIPAYNSAACL